MKKKKWRDLKYNELRKKNGENLKQKWIHVNDIITEDKLRGIQICLAI